MKAIVIVVVLALLVAAVIGLGGGRAGVPDSPTPIAWDRATCSHCRMHIGDPRHAAQLVTDDGAVENFDDPGCAVRWIAEHKPRLHRLWFHGEGERWIPADAVGFVDTGITPMGSRLLAVDATTPGARTLAQVTEASP